MSTSKYEIIASDLAKKLSIKFTNLAPFYQAKIN